MEDFEGHSWYPLEAMLGLLFDRMKEGPGVGSDAVTDKGLERRRLLPEAKRPLDSSGLSLLEQGHLPLLLLQPDTLVASLHFYVLSPPWAGSFLWTLVFLESCECDHQHLGLCLCLKSVCRAN